MGDHLRAVSGENYNHPHLLWMPYIECKKNIKAAFSHQGPQPTKPNLLGRLMGRAVCLAKGIALMVPVLGVVIIVAMRIFVRNEEKNLQPVVKNRVKKQKRVQVGAARAREFDREEPAQKVGELQSREFRRGVAVSKPVTRKLRPVEDSRVVPERKIPPLGICDTIKMDRHTGKIVSLHGAGKFIQDHEILSYGAVLKRQEISDKVFVEYTKHGKAIIQQAATRGCTAATAAMLIVDHQMQPDVMALRTRNLGTDEDQLNDIRKAGLTPIETILSKKNLSGLRECLLNHGSAIISVSGEIGGHVLIVDDVSEDLKSVRIREPYHGWEITITAEAFLKRYDFTALIQVKG